jgi:hypothetical protein
MKEYIGDCPNCGAAMYRQDGAEIKTCDCPGKGEIEMEPVFEINSVGPDGFTPAGCPVCPICHEPTYSLDRCAFCGQRLKREDANE